MSKEMATVDEFVFSLETGFNDVNAYKLNFKKEATFALQLLKANDYLRKTAGDNPESLKNTITNIAAIGISLNPATKEAYLVPRKSQVCLDISAIGLLKLATDSGSIKWAVAELVREKDSFEYRGVDLSPIHSMNPFSERGAIVGVYVIARTSDGDSLVTVMSIKECHDIRDRSEAWKAYTSKKVQTCPWSTDEGEMMKKTIIKRASKTWPKSERLDSAVSVLNAHEGIDFGKEKSPFMDQIISIEAPDAKTFANIRALLKAKKKSEEGLLSYLATQSGVEKIESIEDLNAAQIEYAYRILGGAK